METDLGRALTAALEGGDGDAIVDLLTDIRRARRRELGPVVVPLLRHSDPDVRGAAARTAGDLGAAEAEAILRDLAASDGSRDVRQGAIYGWSSLHSGDRAPDVAVQLERWLRDPAEPAAVRAASFWGLLDVAGLPLHRWPAPAGYADVDAQVPWDLVDEVMAGLRPDV